MRDLQQLPKAHLHIHLEGGMRPQTLRELADQYGVPVPPVSGFGSFTAFVGMYAAACEVLRTPEDLRRIVRETVEDAKAAGAVWVEPAFNATLHRDRLGPEDELTRFVLDVGREYAKEYGVGFGMMIAADRTLDPALAVEVAHRGASLKDEGVVAMGLANDEALFGPEPFAEAFDIAHEAGLLCTPHGGELAGPESVVGCLDALHADRVQHGVRAIEDPELVKRLADAGTCLDVCPTSNVLLSVVPSIAEHPLPQLLDAGVRCSLNGDDPLLFGPGLLEEYELVRAQMGLSDVQLAAIARASVECSGAPRDLVATAVADIDRWLAAPDA